MADLLKLAIGDHITFRVDRVEIVRSGKWPEYHWHGRNAAGPVVVVTPQGAADRQLANNLKMTLAQVEGEVITIERAPNKDDATKSWWNLDLASAADLKQSQSKRLAGPADGPPALHRESGVPNSPEGDDPAPVAPLEGKRGELVEGYLSLYAYVAARLVQLGRDSDFPVDGTSINAATATIAIQLDKRNLL